jgi:hypothetical protein
MPFTLHGIPGFIAAIRCYAARPWVKDPTAGVCHSASKVNGFGKYSVKPVRGPGRFPGRFNSPVKTPGGLVSQRIQPWPGQPCCPGEKAMIRANLTALIKARLRQRRFTPRPYGF